MSKQAPGWEELQQRAEGYDKGLDEAKRQIEGLKVLDHLAVDKKGKTPNFSQLSDSELRALYTTAGRSDQINPIGADPNYFGPAIPHSSLDIQEKMDGGHQFSRQEMLDGLNQMMSQRQEQGLDTLTQKEINRKRASIASNIMPQVEGLSDDLNFRRMNANEGQTITEPQSEEMKQKIGALKGKTQDIKGVVDQYHDEAKTPSRMEALKEWVAEKWNSAKEKFQNMRQDIKARLGPFSSQSVDGSIESVSRAAERDTQVANDLQKATKGPKQQDVKLAEHRQGPNQEHAQAQEANKPKLSQSTQKQFLAAARKLQQAMKEPASHETATHSAPSQAKAKTGRLL